MFCLKKKKVRRQRKRRETTIRKIFGTTKGTGVSTGKVMRTREAIMWRRESLTGGRTRSATGYQYRVQRVMVSNVGGKLEVKWKGRDVGVCRGK